MLSLFNRRRSQPDQNLVNQNNTFKGIPAASNAKIDERKKKDRHSNESQYSYPTLISSAYEGLNSIGEGTYGVVYRAIEKSSGELVALKKIKLASGAEGVASTGVATTAIREIMLLRELDHPHVVELRDVLFNKDALELWLVFEFCPTDLRQYVKQICRVKHSLEGDKVLDRLSKDCVRPEGLPVKQIKSFMYQILDGVSFCHSNRVMHRDLKPQNILLALPPRASNSPVLLSPEENRILDLLKASGTTGENIQTVYRYWTSSSAKIADLGLARACGRKDLQLTQEVVTLWYRAPELLLGLQSYENSVDIWSVGCILAEMITGKPLFAGDSEIDTLFKIFQLLGTPSRDDWENIECLPYYKDVFPRWEVSSPKDMIQKEIMKHFDDPDLLDLLDRCLRYKPEDRLTANAAVRHPWFASM